MDELMADRAQPGAAGGDADAESGSVGDDNRGRALVALEVMRRRGLIDPATYEARRKEIEGA
jgi:hypothetical protein